MKTARPITKGFRFKQFTIEPGHSGMPVSTDGVLLGAWAFTRPPERILDIGCGTGLLSLMCAQRFSDSHIYAIDIDQQAFLATANNVRRSAWSARIEVVHDDITALRFIQPFDAIICNPPYFNSGQPAQQKTRAIARHTDTLSHQQLLLCLTEYLTHQGTASLILPEQEGQALIEQARQQGWYLTRLCQVRSTAEKPVQRLLFELSRTDQQLQSSELIIRESGNYSDAFIQLTRAFYLKMV
ncbi:tRNA1(Val) (adenine(37)-N6)-methyltransferase [Vibrio sp. 11986-1-5]|uniref:tRNA1(Val) (adenine(37)-N6)-methyltransferase n=1 Tax=Vibrio sp. 11986-1-5 TaxID=2211215 RepID=UPI000D72CFFE|nr:tRNA1(Val) (adenine(37)-N6)-methyltransferase [Vibrio sp. 11986-1-5]PXA71294.1 tRNA (adenosine(37)-N6)-methyltransferase TrmM [Vibrio sp. 11986-1-5]